MYLPLKGDYFRIIEVKWNSLPPVQKEVESENIFYMYIDVHSVLDIFDKYCDIWYQSLSM
jgi:hypothetical protein